MGWSLYQYNVLFWSNIKKEDKEYCNLGTRNRPKFRFQTVPDSTGGPVPFGNFGSYKLGTENQLYNHVIVT